MCVQVCFKEIDEIVKFVNKVSEAPFQIDACCGSYMLDAKSIMGMMAIGAGKKVELKIYSDEGIGNLEQLIRTYAA